MYCQLGKHGISAAKVEMTPRMLQDMEPGMFIVTTGGYHVWRHDERPEWHITHPFWGRSTVKMLASYYAVTIDGVRQDPVPHIGAVIDMIF